MKQTLYILLALINLQLVSGNPVKDELRNIDSFLNTDIDSAIVLSKNLLANSEQTENYYGIVKANLYLGYLTKKKEQFGKSVIYYLEGIRKAELANYEGLEVDKIWLRRNLANTFRQFEANSLATKYNLEAIDIATQINNVSQISILKLNQALVYQNSEEYNLAINLLTEIIPLVSDNGFLSEILNQIGIVHHKNGDNELAIDYYYQVLNLVKDSDKVRLFSAKAMHNIGEITYEEGDSELGIEYLRGAIAAMESLDNIEYYGLFLSYRNIGHYLHENGNNIEAKEFLQKAEAIASYAEWDASSFEIYKTFSDLYYSEGNNALGKQYSETYFNKIQEYIETQEDLQKKDKEYNFDLITKRYFDEVEKQERIASIMFWSKLSSGSLLTILLLVIAFNRYEKLKLRKTIERELINLRIIE